MNTAKLYIYGIITILILAAGGGAYWYYHWSKTEIATLRDNNAKLETTVATQKTTIKSMQDDGKRLQENLTVLNTQFAAAREENNVLKEKLSRHNIGYLADRKPALVQQIINKGTKDVGRCFEILSGSPLTKDETAATKRSQINSMCSDIANPNYKATK